MKLITRNTDYALRAICYIAQEGKMVTVAELVSALRVPRPFMRKILQELSKKRILESYKGPAGGFKLRLSAEKIFVIQVMRIFQGQVSLSECFLKKDICPNKGKCVLRKKIRAIEGDMFRQIEKINIASLL